MKLELFRDGSPDCPLLLLYGKDPAVVRALAARLAALADGSLDLDSFPGVEPIGGCRVTAKVARRSTGLRQVGPEAFIWELDATDWDQVVDLLEPFCRPSDRFGFQWLEPATRGDVSFIISDERRW